MTSRERRAKQPISIKFKPEERAFIERCARQEGGVSMSYIVRRSVRAAMDAERRGK